MQEFSDILEWGQGALKTGKITLIAPNHLYALIRYLQEAITGNHKLSLLVHLSFLHQNSLGSIHLKLLSCWVVSMHHFAARVVDSRPSSSYIRQGICLTKCQLQMIWNHRFVLNTGIEPVNSSLDTHTPHPTP